MRTVTPADFPTGSRTDSLTVVSPVPQRDRIDATILLVGNPNTGKTALFNALTGLRAKTANFPGTTVDYRMGRVSQVSRRLKLIDLPGIYSLDALSPEEEVTERALRGEVGSLAEADVVLLVIDSTHLERNLFLSSEVLEMGRPTVVALTLGDAAEKLGIEADADKLAEELGCPVVQVSARTGDGIDRLRSTLCDVLEEQQQPEIDLPTIPEFSGCGPSCRSCPYADRYDWAESVVNRCETATPETHGKTTEAIDGILTHPVVGVLAFMSVMVGVFYLIFSLADLPMGLIEGLFATLGQQVGGFLPVGEMNSLVVDGVIGGVGGVLVFLPQICILFFFITLLEDSGYMARAAFVMEKLMRRVGLPGKAFVPMLSAHACAIPGIMATRVIESRRDRLATILVLPLVTCSARLPVYSMVAVLLFRDEPLLAALLFFAAYALGIVVALVMAFVFKKTLLKGQTRPMVIELPSYRLPSLRNALLTTWDRAKIFCKKAGTVILMISLVLWVLMTYPKQDERDLPGDVSTRVAQFRTEADSRRQQSERLAPDSAEAKRLAAEAEELRVKAEMLITQQGLEYSLAGRIGKLVEPLFRPLGFDWKMNVGVVSSFAARETLVSTLAIVYGIGEQGSDDETALSETLRSQTRDDGTAIFSVPTCFSLLVFYVLAMQCLPTQVITRRETGRWGWAILQLGYMTVLAYGVAFATFQAASIVVGT